MAQGDSVGRDLDKRTRNLSQQRIQPGDGLSAQQIAQNQLQAIQNEQRSNLAQARVQAQADAQAQQIAVQAAQIGTMESGPAVQTLRRYGLTKPRTIRTQSREIKVAPPNITINNTTNNTTTGVGPTAGRELAFRQPQTAFNQPQQSTNKFKSWLSGLLLSQKEANTKREREFDKRESSLVRSSNKMLKRIELAGRDIAENLNPKVIGTTIGNQFRMLLMIFALQFLAKHWEKVLNGIDTVVGFVKDSLDYFGITSKGKSGQIPFYQDLMVFFGANNKDKNLFDVFKRLGKEFIDYLKMSFDHALSLRGDAINAIKPPEIDLSNLGLTLSNIAGYVGNILTAMMDPKKGVRDSVKSAVNSTMTAVTRDSDKEKIKFDDEVKGVRGLKDTSYGDYAAEKRQALTQNALDSSGHLRNNTWASISQGRDIAQAFNNSKNGDIDVARLGGGLQRLQDTADKEGYVTLDPTALDTLFGDKLAPLLRAKEIESVPMKYVQVEKSDADYADEGANPDKAMEKGYIKGLVLDKIPGAGIANSASKGYEGMTWGIKTGSKLGPASGLALPLAQAGGMYGTVKGYLETTPWGGAAVGAFEAGMKKKFWSDKNTLKLVPVDDPRPGVALDGKIIRTMYQVKPSALRRLASILTRSDKITKIDTGSEEFMKALENHLIDRAGGVDRVKSRDLDIAASYKAVHDIEAREKYYEEEEKNSLFMQHVGLIGNNAKRAVNGAIQTMGRAITTAGDFITGISGGSSSSAIENWLWGGNAPKEYNPKDKAHMDARVTTISVPIHNMNGDSVQKSITVNKLLAQSVRTIFTEIYETVPDFRIDPSTTAGYVYRPRSVKGGSTKRLSIHSLGGAVDINWSINPQGDTSTQDTTTHFGTEKHPVVQIFTRNSWKWGGKWKGDYRDTMHFEYAGRVGAVSEAQSAPQSYSYSVGEEVPSSSSVPQGGGGVPTSGQFHATQGAYADYQAPVIQPTGQASFLDWKESAGTGIGKKFNNPGNRTQVDSKFGSGVVKQGKMKWTTYSSLENGFAGNADLVIKYLRGEAGPLKKNPTIREFISSWCPPRGNNGETPEKTAQYIKDVAEWSGFGTDTPIPLTLDSVRVMTACLARHDSGIVNQEGLLKGTSKAWDLYKKTGGEDDNGNDNIGVRAGNLLKDAGGYLENTQLFDVDTREEEAAKLRHQDNWDTVSRMAFDRDAAKIKQDTYFTHVYGDNATTDSIAAEWDKDPSKRNRDMKYSELYSKADELWRKFGSNGEELRRQLLGPSTTKEEFRKYFSTLSRQDQNLLIRRFNKWNRGRFSNSDNLDDYERGLYNKVSGIGWGAYNGEARISEADMTAYVKLMKSGQYDRAEALLNKYYADMGDDNKYKKEAFEAHRRTKALDLHGEDENYRDLQYKLAAAEEKLEKAKKEDTSNNRWWKFWKSDEDKNASAAAVADAQEEVDALKQKTGEYEKIDSAVNSALDVDPNVIKNYNSATSKSLEIRKKIEELEKEMDNATFGTEEEGYEFVKKSQEEVEKLQKELKENEDYIRKLIGDGQGELLSMWKDSVKSLYENSGHQVEEAEEEYTKLIDSGKTHVEAMAEIGNKFDKETINYLQNFGEVIVKEKEEAEERARQQLYQLAADLAKIDVGSIDWKDEFFQGADTAEELARRAKIKDAANKGLPITNISGADVPKGYAYYQEYGAYLPSEQKKWAPELGKFRYDSKSKKMVENTDFYKNLRELTYSADTPQYKLLWNFYTGFVNFANSSGTQFSLLNTTMSGAADGIVSLNNKPSGSSQPQPAPQPAEPTLTRNSYGGFSITSYSDQFWNTFNRYRH